MTDTATTPDTIMIEYGDNFMARIDDGPWHQPAGKWGRGGMMPKIARKLIEEGRDPTTPIQAVRNGTIVWAKAMPLSYWAGLSVSEPDTGSLRLVSYIAMPKYWDENTTEEGETT